jgi:hypothetical protein
MATETASASARSFVRSLNVLLKFARLYGVQHSRAAAQFDAAWVELETALAETGLLLGSSGSQLLVDGVPIECTPAERSFAELLSSAGVASICFTRSLNKEQLSSFVRAFIGGGKSANLAEQLKTLLGQNGMAGIRVNEVRFVAEDAGYADAQLAAQITARTLGADAGKMQAWLRDPQKLIQLIAAAEGAESGAGPGTGLGLGPGPGGVASPGAGLGTGQGGKSESGVGTATGTAAGSGLAPSGGSVVGLMEGLASVGNQNVAGLAEEEVLRILRLLVQMGEAGRDKSAPADPAVWRQKVADLPEPAQITLRQALASMAAAAPNARPDEPLLVRLAEDLAIRYALERYQRGEVRVNAVRQLLGRMGREVENLRKLLTAREEKLAGAGINVESHADLLDRQFWASVPESGKRAVLLTPEAWCIPPRNVQQFVEELFEVGDTQTAEAILLQYAACVREKDPEARRKVSIGLGQMAELYSRAGIAVMDGALRQLGAQMKDEREADLQTLLGAAFVRFSQEAGKQRDYILLRTSLDCLAEVEKARPSWVQGLRPRIGVENRLPEFIEEALTSPKVPEGLLEILKRMPQVAADQLAGRLPRCVLIPERERLVELAEHLGAPCIQHLRESLRLQPASRAVLTLGLLSRLDSEAMESILPGLLPQWNRAFHDSALRQLSVAGSPGRGRLLAKLLDRFDVLVQPLVVDEIGMSGDAGAVELLQLLVEDESGAPGTPYVRVKAIEALGRLRALSAVDLLQQIVETKRAWRWAYPSELRMAAARALETIDPDWARSFLAHSGLEASALAMGPQDYCPREAAVRMRRYPRVRLTRGMSVQVSNPRGKFALNLKSLSLGGGVLFGDHQLPGGTEAQLKIHPGFWSIGCQVILRLTKSQHTVFEIVAIDLEERAKLRKLLVSLCEDSPPDRQLLSARS